jgi:preprotein translocase subunit SecE
MLKVTEFIDQVVKETGKISWSTRKETTVSMMMVIVMVIIASLLFLLVDTALHKIVQLLLNLGVN